jgi:CheY-like chemotaxis protein
MKILILEDVAETRNKLKDSIEEIKRAVRRTDCQVIPHMDPGTAFQDAVAEKPDLIIVDLFMPSGLVNYFAKKKKRKIGLTDSQ